MNNVSREIGTVNKTNFFPFFKFRKRLTYICGYRYIAVVVIRKFAIRQRFAFFVNPDIPFVFGVNAVCAFKRDFKRKP